MGKSAQLSAFGLLKSSTCGAGNINCFDELNILFYCLGNLSSSLLRDVSKTGQNGPVIKNVALTYLMSRFRHFGDLSRINKVHLERCFC